MAALKGIVTNHLLVGQLALHPMDLLLRMSPLALVQTLIYAYCTGTPSHPPTNPVQASWPGFPPPSHS